MHAQEGSCLRWCTSCDSGQVHQFAKVRSIDACNVTLTGRDSHGGLGSCCGFGHWCRRFPRCDGRGWGVRGICVPQESQRDRVLGAQFASNRQNVRRTRGSMACTHALSLHREACSHHGAHTRGLMSGPWARWLLALARRLMALLLLLACGHGKLRSDTHHP
jgi:hypothetical protein